MIRVAVCGGRFYGVVPHLPDHADISMARYQSVNLMTTLDRLCHERGGFEVLVHGGAPGADRWAKEWAKRRGFTDTPFMADWRGRGHKAGPERNQRMIDEGRLDLVVAFPGGTGTADMVRRAKAAGIEVIEVAS